MPTTVRLAPMPTVLVDIHPAWRSYEYFVYNEQVIIVDPHDWHAGTHPHYEAALCAAAIVAQIFCGVAGMSM